MTENVFNLQEPSRVDFFTFFEKVNKVKLSFDLQMQGVNVGTIIHGTPKTDEVLKLINYLIFNEPGQETGIPERITCSVPMQIKSLLTSFNTKNCPAGINRDVMCRPETMRLILTHMTNREKAEMRVADNYLLYSYLERNHSELIRREVNFGTVVITSCTEKFNYCRISAAVDVFSTNIPMLSMEYGITRSVAKSRNTADTLGNRLTFPAQ